MTQHTPNGKETLHYFTRSIKENLFCGFHTITTEENGTLPKCSEMSYYSRELLYELNFVIHIFVKFLHLSLNPFEGHLVASCY